MKFSLLPLLATTLPLLLVQHAAPANAAALCIPGIYCPQSSSAPPPRPGCSTASGGGHDGSSSTSGTIHHWSPSSQKPTPTAIPTTLNPSPTSTVFEPPYTTTSASSSKGSSTAKTTSPTSTPKASSSSKAAGSSSGDSRPTAATTVTVTSAPAPTGNTCSTGPVQCCDTVEPASSKRASSQLGLLGIVLQDLNIPVGFNCNPLSILGEGSAGFCNSQTVCCENNNFNGLINIGCTPINIGL